MKITILSLFTLLLLNPFGPSLHAAAKKGNPDRYDTETRGFVLEGQEQEDTSGAQPDEPPMPDDQ